MDDLDTLKALPQDEQRAFLAWFTGVSPVVMHYPSSPSIPGRAVIFGHHECDHVDFTKFWLEKMVDLGWFAVDEVKRGKALGMIEQPEYVMYGFAPTELGWNTRDAYWASVLPINGKI